MISAEPPTFDADALLAANVNPATYLATDYLNHFNEAVMLLGLAADMPDMLDEVRGWEPRSYRRHFAESGFQGRDLAISAYDASPPRIRARFEATIAEIDTLLLVTIDTLANMANDDPRFAFEAADAVKALHALIDRASGIVNGVDAGAPVDVEEADPNAAQNAIDALFDAA